MKRTLSWLLGAAVVLAAVAATMPRTRDAAAQDRPAPQPAIVLNAEPEPPAERPRVILMIGDGMGRGQLEAASRFRYGRAGGLFLESLPVVGEVQTSSLSGTTDSAAAATAMATGVRTQNTVVGLDRHGQPAETLVELAHRRGLAAGVVTTSSLTHATPASFTAHHPSRHDYVELADDMAQTRAEVMLGGGARYFLPAGEGSVRDDEGWIGPLKAGGYMVVSDRAALDDVKPAAGRLLGLFASEHLRYVLDREAAETQPTLTEMSLKALEVLDADPDGFFLMIEGARIDHGGHQNALEHVVEETLAFDDAVAAVAAWAAEKEGVTLLVTADHETGGLKVTEPAPAGELSGVTWRWGSHTDANVGVFGAGPGTRILDGAAADHRWIHAALAARISGQPTAPPAPVSPRRPPPSSSRR